MTALSELDCGTNGFIGALDASGSPALNVLRCYENQFTSLTVSGLTALNELFCANNKLTGLDVSNLTALEKLNCFGNDLTSLDVHSLTALKSLECSDNGLTGILDISGSTALEGLNCYGNQLANLNMSGLTKLKKLFCSFNNLSGTLDLSGLTALTELECFKNKLTGLNVSGLSSLYFLNCSSNSLNSLNLSGVTEQEWLHCSGNQLSTFTLSGIVMKYLCCQNNYMVSKEDIVGLNEGQLQLFKFLPQYTLAPTSTTTPAPTNTPTPANIGSGLQLTARITPANARNKTIAWASGNPAVATVDANGHVQSVSIGTAVITATTVNGLTASCRLTVKPIMIFRITLSLRRATVSPNQQFTLSASIAPGSATNRTVSWFSSRPAIASVDQNGVVTSIAAGKATITCIANDGSRKKATSIVTVK